MRATMFHLLSAAEQAQHEAAPLVIAPPLALHSALPVIGVVTQYRAHACRQHAVFKL